MPVITLDEAPPGARVIVCGGTGYFDRDRMFEVLDLLRPSEIANGAAPGADSLSTDWAVSRGVPFRLYRAHWKWGGRATGAFRNQHMFNSFRPDGIVAAPGGRGTRNMEIIGLEGGVWVARFS